MWLVTKLGFYSIVQKEDGFHVRAREKHDLENLVKAAGLTDAKIIETPSADYACRIIASKAEVLQAMAALGEGIDYDNFKNKIHATPDQAHKPVGAVWKVFSDALGSYGRKPRG